MTSTIEISKALPQFLMDMSNVDEKVQVVEITFADEEDPNDVDGEEQSEWDDLETDTEYDVFKFSTILVMIMVVRMLMGSRTKMMNINF